MKTLFLLFVLGVVVPAMKTPVREVRIVDGNGCRRAVVRLQKEGWKNYLALAKSFTRPAHECRQRRV